MKREIQKFAASGRFRIRDGDGVPDGDGTTDGYDTDGDGVPDGAEVLQGSDPADATDGGAPNSRTLLGFYFGDHSGSHSEKYRLNVVPVSGHGDTPRTQFRVNACYGQCETTSVILKPGWSYSVTLEHAGTKYGEETDYDYTLTLSQPVPSNVIVDDPDGLFGVDDTSSSFAAAGKEAMLYVLGRPRLVPDYDRNGEIDEDDIADAATNRVFRFWINDDEDDESTYGKYAESPSVDIPGAQVGWSEFDWRDPDWNDTAVNGYRDLIDFTPVFMDISTTQILPDRIRTNLTFKLSHASGAVNVVWTALPKASVGLFQKGNVEVCGRNLNEASYEAETERVESGGTDVPDALVAQMNDSPSNKGVIFIEGRAAAESPLKLDIYYNNQKVVSGELPLHLSTVEEMYLYRKSKDVHNEENPDVCSGVDRIACHL